MPNKPEKRDIPVKDFLEEQRRLKEVNANPPLQSTFLQQIQNPAAQPPVPQSSAASQSSLAPRSAEPEHQQPVPFAQLVESLKGLGYDIKPLEALRSYTELLDSEEQRLVKEIQERQKRLEIVRAARRLLKVVGV